MIRFLARWLHVLLPALLLAGCSHPAPPVAPLHQSVDGMTITLLAGSPHTGDNTLTITLADAASQAPIGNANVTVQANMLSPRMIGTAVSGRAQGNGRYDIPVRLAVATRYALALHIERGGMPATDVIFPLEAVE